MLIISQPFVIMPSCFPLFVIEIIGFFGAADLIHEARLSSEMFGYHSGTNIRPTCTEFSGGLHLICRSASIVMLLSYVRIRHDFYFVCCRCEQVRTTYFQNAFVVVLRLPFVFRLEANGHS
jgi:hypothetical protein